MASSPIAAPAAEELYSAAEFHVRAMGRRFGDGADLRLREMTDHAGSILDRIDDGEARAEAIEVARLSLIELLDDAALIASRTEGYPDDLLGEISFFPALARFCPRFPFC